MTWPLIMRVALLLGMALLAQTAPGAPGPQLDSAAQELVTSIRLDMADPSAPRIQAQMDFPRMTRAAVARGWHLASPAQQEALTGGFRALVLRTYAIALAGRREHMVEFKRLQAAPADTEATLRSVLRLPGSSPLAIDYDLERVSEGWKITDIKIGGISLVSNYRQVFSSQMRESGVDGLIRALAERSQPGARPHATELYVPVALAYAATARQIFVAALRGN